MLLAREMDAKHVLGGAVQEELCRRAQHGSKLSEKFYLLLLLLPQGIREAAERRKRT